MLDFLFVFAGVGLNWLILYFWQPWTNAYAGEKGKNLARKADLDKILIEVHHVTETQKRIEARISGEIWHQQWLTTERRNAYVSVITAFRKYLQTLDDYVENGRIHADVIEIGRVKLGQAADEMNHSMTICELFGKPRFCEELDVAMKYVNEASTSSTLLVHREKIDSLRSRLAQLARQDLGVENATTGIEGATDHIY